MTALCNKICFVNWKNVFCIIFFMAIVGSTSVAAGSLGLGDYELDFSKNHSVALPATSGLDELQRYIDHLKWRNASDGAIRSLEERRENYHELMVRLEEDLRVARAQADQDAKFRAWETAFQLLSIGLSIVDDLSSPTNDGNGQNSDDTSTEQPSGLHGNAVREAISDDFEQIGEAAPDVMFWCRNDGECSLLMEESLGSDSWFGSFLKNTYGEEVRDEVLAAQRLCFKDGDCGFDLWDFLATHPQTHPPLIDPEALNPIYTLRRLKKAVGEDFDRLAKFAGLDDDASKILKGFIVRGIEVCYNQVLSKTGLDLPDDIFYWVTGKNMFKWALDLGDQTDSCKEN